MSASSQLDVIVRFHDVGRLWELERCVFSLVNQSYRPLHVILALQRFSADDIARVRATLVPFLDADDIQGLTILNWEEPYPPDARSVLLNMGLRSARGRYLAFLDYDDVMYPEAYELMISRLENSEAAIAFATVRVMRVELFSDFHYMREKVDPPFSGANLLDLFRNNFCPLHSYLIARHRVSNDMLFFDTAITMEEDYDLLLRLCARYLSDFSLVETPIGEYYYKTDGSNTVPTECGMDGSRLAYYQQVVAPTIERRRRSTVVSAQVARSLGMAGDASLTIRDVIAAHE